MGIMPDWEVPHLSKEQFRADSADAFMHHDTRVKASSDSDKSLKFQPQRVHTFGSSGDADMAEPPFVNNEEMKDYSESVVVSSDEGSIYSLGNKLDEDKD